MTRLEVLAADPVTTVQDRGRFGVQRFGLPPSGAMDRAALAAANVLVGNESDAAAIEVGPFGAEFAARNGAVRVAIAGAVRALSRNGEPISANQSLLLADGERLRIGPARDGVFSYLAIEGGIAGEPVFGSLAVNSRAGLGSPYPRPLAAGDSIATQPPRPLTSEVRLDLDAAESPAAVRVVLGPQDDEFDAATKALLLESAWTISAASDRMGYRLEGPRLVHRDGHNIVSDGTVTGSIQVPGSGHPIVLMPDRGTTGGYPKIATVISADLGRLAQIRVGGSLRFRAVSIGEAQAAARQYATRLASLASHVRDAESGLDLAALHRANVAGSAVNAVEPATWHAAADQDPTEQDEP
jgi:biotin-dependent carboxylase-like uncharacterized protein